MKILAVYNNDHKASQTKSFDKAVDYLKRLGHNIKQDIDWRGKDLNIDKFQSKLEKAIKDTDIVVTEITNADAKVGFDIARAIAEKKIVVALQKEGSKSPQISSIHGNNARTLLIKDYTEKNIEEVIDKAVNEAKGKLDTKFILIISPEIDRYLDWAAQTKRMHKAQIVRNSIEDSIKKDKEYKNYLKG